MQDPPGGRETRAQGTSQHIGGRADAALFLNNCLKQKRGFAIGGRVVSGWAGVGFMEKELLSDSVPRHTRNV